MAVYKELQRSLQFIEQDNFDAALQVLTILLKRDTLTEYERSNVLQYIVLIMVSLVLATGMSWSHIRRRLTGQLDVDDVDE